MADQRSELPFDSTLALANHVVLPTPLYHRMCQCYYGHAPRAWETDAPFFVIPRGGPTLTPPPTQNEVLATRVEGKGVSDVRTPETAAKIAPEAASAMLQGLPPGFVPRGVAASRPSSLMAGE